MNNNVDITEVEKFNQFASRWWDPHGELRTLHLLNPLRVDYINQQCSLSGKKVLDVGCGAGLLSEAMANFGADVTGIDMAEQALEVAKLHLLQSKLEINYLKSPVEEYAIDNTNAFDLITCLEMLEHVPDPQSVVTACASLVKPGGSVIFSTINKTIKSYLFAIVGAENILKILPRGTHDHNKFIPPSQLDSWAREINLKLNHSTGIHYNPINEIFSLNPDHDVNYLMQFIKHE